MNDFAYHNPKELEALIRKSVVGQDDGVRMVATALAAHLARTEHNEKRLGPPFRKDNLLIAGPTGSGKTESIRAVIRECDLPIPVAVISTNNLTTSGYKGKSVETILQDLYVDAYRIINSDIYKYVGDEYEGDELKRKASEAAIRLANKGIIILDEADKIRVDPRDSRDDTFFQRNLQQQLLKLIEGGTGFGESPELSKIDTTDILFILCGAFSGLDEITRRRLNPGPGPERKKRIGFLDDSGNPGGNPDPAPLKELTAGELAPSTEDLVEYGFIPELVGRITFRCRYNPITADILYNILQASNISPAKEFRNFILKTRNRLEFTDDALMEIARQAEELRIGVRGLRSIIGSLIYPAFYDLSGRIHQQVVITRETVRGEAPLVIRDITYGDAKPRTGGKKSGAGA